jgi:hypothetical protein
MPSDGGYSLNLQVPTLAATLNVVFPASTAGTITLMTLGAAGEMTGPVKINAVGGGTPTALTNCGLYIYGTSAAGGYVQASIQNLTPTGSSDFVVTLDNGNDSNNYLSVGGNNSAYSNGSWTVNGAGDFYLSAVGGGLALGTDVPGKPVVIYCGGTLDSNKKIKATDTYVCAYRATVCVGMGGVTWTKIAATTLASWTTAASCIGAASTGVTPDGSTPTLTFPANFFVAGRTVRLKLRGQFTTYSSIPTFTISVALQGITICTTAATSGLESSLTTNWEMEVELTCRQTGASATIIGNGMITYSNNTDLGWVYRLASNTAQNVDTTATATIDVKVACSASNAANTWTVNHCTIEVLG